MLYSVPSPLLGFFFGMTFLFGTIMPCNLWAGGASSKEDPFYTQAQIFSLRPNSKKEREFGCVGATGLVLWIHPGVQLKVEKTLPGSPADGKFTVGDLVVAVNGRSLKGLNPFSSLGHHLTTAEGTDGKMIFEVISQGKKKEVLVNIPVLGSYSNTWPKNCSKSKTIITKAKNYYGSLKFNTNENRSPGDDATDHGVGGALVNLFLLSTGDDHYLKNVRSYLEYFLKNLDKIGHHTWNNGYNGLLTAEYYLRTGDRSVLPILQYYCDAARDTQFYGVGWNHWGTSINPRYMGGLMNPAGAQVLTTLLLAKQCGVNVDEKTLLGALRYWYRFSGRGTVPYGDHRGEGGLGSNGKDGMAAAAMQVATHAKGDVTIYKEARNYFSMSMLTSYTKMMTGHADNGRGDGIWRGLSSVFMSEVETTTYQSVMGEIAWWYDVSRRPSGAFGLTSIKRFNEEFSGAGAAMAYTAPLKTLQITGAPRSKFATDFELPSQLWGTKADREFNSTSHDDRYFDLGKERPINDILADLGSAYSSERKDISSVPVKTVLQNVFHKRFMVRAQATKALSKMGQFKEIEKLLVDPSPRVRRAALDGLTDYRYWFAMGKNPIAKENFSSTMLKSITKILDNPNESWYVVDGALLAMNRASAKDIVASLNLIQPYLSHSEWWLRQSAVIALFGACEDKTTVEKVLPLILTRLEKEEQATTRGTITHRLKLLLKKITPKSAIRQQIALGLVKTSEKLPILQGHREGEGGHAVTTAILQALTNDPSQGLALARIVKGRLSDLESRWLGQIVPAILKSLEKLNPDDSLQLNAILYEDFRAELLMRLEKGEDVSLDTLITLANIKQTDVGWKPLTALNPKDRVWRHLSFDCSPDDKLHPRVGKRFRDVKLPEHLKGWEQPDFDDRQWFKGKAPIGVGLYHQKRKKDVFIENVSDWGEGEFLVMRADFELESTDHDYYRLKVLANQGFRVYLNGHPIHTYIWWNNTPHYRPIGLKDQHIQHLKKGKNLIAIYANCAYPDQGPAVGQIDIRIEGLKKSDLMKGHKNQK
jgi:HEAT repeat protein